MKKQLILILITFLSLSSYGQTTTRPLNFSYAFLFREPGTEAQAINPNTSETRLSSQAEIKVFLKPGPGVNIYLFLQDEQDALYLLFPEKPGDLDCCYSFAQSYTYPPANSWTGFDQSQGKEKFLLLASTTRLRKLEELTTIYLPKLSRLWQSPDNIKLIQETAQARHSIIEEIAKLRLEYSEYQSAKEKPVVIAGEFRDGEIPEGITATEVSANGFYAKTIRLVHGDNEKP
ncbi:MAG: hypothetical protein JXR70_02235 [Spirochaetales bacterium]|nr:hypothetical protein [Spirochaetales bacterium]